MGDPGRPLSAVGFQKASSLCCNPFVFVLQSDPLARPCACLSPLHSGHAWASTGISPPCLDFASPDGEELQANNIPLPVCTDYLRNSSPCTPLQPVSTSLGLGRAGLHCLLSHPVLHVLPSPTPCTSRAPLGMSQTHEGFLNISFSWIAPRLRQENTQVLECKAIETYPARGFPEASPHHCQALRSSNRTSLVQRTSDSLLHIPQPAGLLCPKQHAQIPPAFPLPFLRPNPSQQMPGCGATPEIRLQP